MISAMSLPFPPEQRTHLTITRPSRRRQVPEGMAPGKVLGRSCSSFGKDEEGQWWASNPASDCRTLPKVTVSQETRLLKAQTWPNHTAGKWPSLDSEPICPPPKTVGMNAFLPCCFPRINKKSPLIVVSLSKGQDGRFQLNN